MEVNGFYSGQRVLSTRDLDGLTPELFLVTSNKSAGKTTYFANKLIADFLNEGKQFVVYYRFMNEIYDGGIKFYNDVSRMFFPEYDFKQTVLGAGSYCEISINGKPAGWCLAINSADKLKRMSHFFNSASQIFFDEFQSETNHYCPNELTKFYALHTALARGNGQQRRYLPVYMCSNPYSLLNPYFVALGISSRLKSDTKILRGHGFVLENDFISSASKAMETSGFVKAFKAGGSSEIERYSQYSFQAVYMDDNAAFVEKLGGTSHYLLTLAYNGDKYAIRFFPQQGLFYCDNKYDETFPIKIAFSAADMTSEFTYQSTEIEKLRLMRNAFERGKFRFKNVSCKDAIINFLRY